MNTNSHHIEFKRLLNLYARRAESPEEYQKLLEFLEIKRDLLEDSDIELLSGRLNDELTDESFQRVYANVINELRRGGRRSTMKWWMAAASLLIVSSSIVWRIYNMRQGSQSVQQSATIAEGIKYTGRRYVQLSDGTKVMLKAGSELVVEKSFGGSNRVVALRGEAFFDVAHDSTKAFIVNAGNLTTTVLGTAFNVVTDSGQTKIVVARGKVRVQDNSGRTEILLPNQQLEASVGKKTFNKAVVSVDEAAFEWRREFVVLNDASMEEVAQSLTRNYNVEIKFSNSGIRNCRFEGSFFADDELEIVLPLICRVVGCTYRGDGNGVIILEGPGC